MTGVCRLPLGYLREDAGSARVLVGESVMLRVAGSASREEKSPPGDGSGPARHLSCLLDYGVPVFTDDVALSNYPVFKGPATL